MMTSLNVPKSQSDLAVTFSLVPSFIVKQLRRGSGMPTFPAKYLNSVLALYFSFTWVWTCFHAWKDWASKGSTTPQSVLCLVLAANYLEVGDVCGRKINQQENWLLVSTVCFATLVRYLRHGLVFMPFLPCHAWTRMMQKSDIYLPPEDVAPRSHHSVIITYQQPRPRCAT